MWSESEAVKSSRGATERSGVAMMFGGHDDHAAASHAHGIAAKAAHQLADKHESLGNHKAAAKFRALAEHHEASETSHARESERLKPSPKTPASPSIAKAARRIDPARSRAALKGATTRSERDEAAKVNIPAHLHPLWEETKAGFKGTPHERVEHFTKYVEEHEHEAVRAMQKESDNRLEDLIREYQAR